MLGLSPVNACTVTLEMIAPPHTTSLVQGCAIISSVTVDTDPRCLVFNRTPMRTSSHQITAALPLPFNMSRIYIRNYAASIHIAFRSFAPSNILSEQHSLILGFLPSCIIRSFLSILYLALTMTTVPTFAERWPTYLSLLIVLTKGNIHLQFEPPKWLIRNSSRCSTIGIYTITLLFSTRSHLYSTCTVETAQSMA